MKSQAQKIDFLDLPDEARKEMTSFYKFLQKKYNLKRHLKTKKDRVDNFFDRYQLNMKSFKFNREESHER